MAAYSPLEQITWMLFKEVGRVDKFVAFGGWGVGIFRGDGIC